MINKPQVFDGIAFFLIDRVDFLSQADYAVISSFQYERVILADQLYPDGSYALKAETYKLLLSLPRITISSNLPTFGFFDPDIHIIDLQGHGEALQQFVRTDRNGEISIEFNVYPEF